MILDTVFLNGWYSISIQNDIVGHSMILWNGKTNGWYGKFPIIVSYLRHTIKRISSSTPVIHPSLHTRPFDSLANTNPTNPPPKQYIDQMHRSIIIHFRSDLKLKHDPSSVPCLTLLPSSIPLCMYSFVRLFTHSFSHKCNNVTHMWSHHSQYRY